MLFSHSNFFSYGTCALDWSYVNSPEDYCKQIEIVSGLGYSLGVLGHTHRARLFSFVYDHVGAGTYVDRKRSPNERLGLSRYNCTVANVGSIGQPRERPLSAPAWMLIECDQYSPDVITYMPFDYDTSRHLGDI